MPPPEPLSSDRGVRWPAAAKWLTGVLIVLTLAAGATYSYRQQAELRRGRAEWDAEVARIRASGDPLTGSELDAFYTVPEGEEDVTQLYVEALKGCKRDYVAAEDLPIVGSKDEDSITIPPQTWPDLERAEAYLEQYRIPLQQLAAAGEQGGRVRFPIQLQQLSALRSDHMVALRDALQLIELQRACRIHRRDYRGVAESLISMHRLANTLRDEPTVTAQQVRAAFAGVIGRQVKLTVGDASFPIDELKHIQTAFVGADWQRACFLSSLSERADYYDLLHKPVSLLDPKAHVSSSFVLLLSRPGDAARVLGTHSDYVDAARGELPTMISAYQAMNSRTQVWALERAGPPTQERRPVTSTTTAFLYFGSHTPLPYLRAATSQRASVAVLAIERFRREQGQLPDTLDELVPRYLEAVPADPYNGYPLRFVKRVGGYVVYSVGMDLVDDVGDVEYRDDHAAADEGLFVPAIVGS